MQTLLYRAAGGLAFAIVLVYLLIVVNFQSWLDPFIIITALPAALAGIVLFLFLTHTTLSVPALMGSIMCMGVATANSILVVASRRSGWPTTATPLQAAIEAGFTRFRPVLMTALAMIIGMVPMALGLGEGGEQNAPLGRAVIGGLMFATVATLIFVPAVFSLLAQHGVRIGGTVHDDSMRTHRSEIRHYDCRVPSRNRAASGLAAVVGGHRRAVRCRRRGGGLGSIWSGIRRTRRRERPLAGATTRARHARWSP